MARSSSKRKRAPKSVLKLPDLEQSKSAVLNSLTSPSSQRSYDHAIREFIDWYCSEPRLAFNKTVRLAAAAPIPLFPPVMSATFPANSKLCSILLRDAPLRGVLHSAARRRQDEGVIISGDIEARRGEADQSESDQISQTEPYLEVA